MDVAIVGIGCRLPGGAETPEQFWDLLCRGADAITEVPPDRFDLNEVFDPDPAVPGKIYTRWGGFVDNVDRFDADFFGVAPREAKRMDPQHRLLLEVVWEALEDGGQVPERLAGTNTGVFIGIATHDYGDLQMTPHQRGGLDAHVNIGNALSAAPNRLSYQFDLRGPSMAIETACSSSLTAVHLACRSLEAGESTLAIAGGVNMILAPDLTIGFCKATMMSPDGRCYAFDTRANGYVRSEGAGVVILKPLAQAQADGDPLYAVVRGTAINEDGRTAGISLPNAGAHESLLRQALRDADVTPSAIQYFEAHGTGTAVGDPAEANAIGRVFGAGRPPGEELLVGSVKTNIGHLEAGSGIAGLIKAALMLRHKQIPPSLHFRDPNPAIAFDELRLRVPTALEPWPATDGPAMAGVNSFGFGGANAHVVLEEALPLAEQADEDAARTHVLLLSARTEDALRQTVEGHRAVLARNDLRLHDVCHTAALRRSHHEHRLAAVGVDTGDLVTQLDAFLDGETSPAVITGRSHRAREGKLAFVFAGMGPQRCGMGRQLMAGFPVFREALEDFDRALVPLSGWSVVEELAADEAESRIEETHVAQVVNCAVQIALARLWRSLGVVPDAVVGHSAGELAAAHVSGALTLPDTVRAALHRGRLLHRATGTGTMLAAGISAEEATRLADASAGRVSLAAVNSRTSVTLSGDVPALEAIAESLEHDERFWRFLPVQVPYHGPQLDALRDELLDALRDLDPGPTAIPLVSEVTGTWAGEHRFDGAYWWRNIRQPVQFAGAVETLVADGYDLFLEISPHPVLASYVAECLAEHDVPGTVVPSLRRDEDEPRTVLRSLATLHVRGRPVDWSALYRDGACVRLPTYPWQRERHWFEPAKPAVASVGVDSGHPLLGRRLPTAHPSWETDLDDPRSDYLDAHVVEDSAVFPGAAYVEMALAAARQVHGETPVALEDVELRQLLFLPRPRQVRLQLLYTPRDAALEILSAPLDEPAAWRLHATATVRPQGDRGSAAHLDLDPVRERCAEAVPVADYYRTYAAYGFRYGSPFRGLEQTWAGDGEALARIRFPDDVDLPVTGHQVHPALLDAGFQLLVAAARGTASGGDQAGGPLFPVSFRRVVWHRSPGERFWGHARVRQAQGEIDGDVTLVTDEGLVAVSCEGLRFKVLDAAKRQERATGEDSLYELGWEPASLTRPARPSAVLPSPHEVVEALERGDGPEQRPDVATYHETVAPILNRVTAGMTAAALNTLGWEAPRDRHAPAEEVADRLGVVPPHRRLFATLLEMMETLTTRGDGAATLITDRAALGRELDELTARLPAFAAEAELLRLGGDRLAEVLRGEVDAREILLGDDGLDVLRRLYHGSPPGRAYHALLADGVAAAIEAAKPTAPLRLLEVGAGTGAATAAILARLPDSAEYVFTDISPAFLSAARERFGGRAGIRFEVLDVEVDPAVQHFEPHSFDVVVGDNVLHTTADLRASLGHLTRLLAPGGLLALLELATPTPWFNLTFGLLEGWWRFRDHDTRRDSPLLDADRWRALLNTCGFEHAVAPFAPEPGMHALQTVLLAHAPSATGPAAVAPPASNDRGSARMWLLFADDHDVATRLAATLRDGGDHCRFVTRGQSYRRRPDGVVELPPGDASAALQLLEDLSATGERCDGIIHLWSVDVPATDGMTATELMGAQRLGCGSVLALTQALEQADGESPALWLVTSGSQAVTGHDGAPHVAQSPLWGLGRVLMNEHATTRCRLIDLGPACGPEEIAALADEVRGDGDDEEVALRGHERYVRTVRRTSLDALTEPARTRPCDPVTDAFRLETDGAGTFDRLALRETAVAEPGAGEVAIRVRASALNFRDVLKTLGMLPDAALGADPEPRALGIECSGTVVACGEGVDEFRPGDEVVALAWAAHGSRVVARADLTLHKPPGVTFVQGASLAAAFMTAEYALNHVARVASGERVLIHSAAGAVGLAAIQLCKRAGAEVFATAGTPEKREHLAALGIEHVMDSRSLEFADEVRRRTGGEGVDVVLNSLGGEAMRLSLDLLRAHGRFVELGKRDIYDDVQLGLLPFQRNLSYTAIDLISFATDRPEQAKRLLQEAVRQVADGVFQPIPCTTFDLGEASQAFRFMAQARHIGKVVLTVDEPHYEVRPAGDEPPCRADATYLVTGGLGGFGLAVAGWLVKHGARSLVLMSRSGVPKEGGGALEALRSSPASVHVVRGDAASEQDVARVLDRIRRELPPLRGVVHAAMVLDDDVLARLDDERFRAVLAPKVAGAWNLHRLTVDVPLDFFLLFSSVASVLGHPMQGNYAAANAFLDSLASNRKALGLPALAIGWGAIADVGYVARHPEVAKHLDRGGFKSFTPQEALDILGALLFRDRAYVMAALIDWAKLVGVNPLVATSRRFRAFVAEAADSDTGTAGGESAGPLSSLRDLPPEERGRALEQYLVEKVAHVLGSAPPRIDPERPLTEMGFDSLMAVELATAIKTDLGVRLPAVKILQGGTCRGLATTVLDALPDEDSEAGETETTAVTGQDRGEEAETTPPPLTSPSDEAPTAESDAYPLSFEQRRLWFLQRLEPGNPAYNIPTAVQLRGPLDVEALRRSLHTAVERHEVLRAAIRDVDGEPVQVFGVAAPIALPVVDLSHLTEPERAVELQRQAGAATRRPFDLTTGPLIRAALFRLTTSEHVLLLVVHHIACDAWSMNWMAREMATLYEAFSAGEQASLPPPAFRYVDYVRRERERLDDELVDGQLAYWTRQLAGAPTALRLPGDEASAHHAASRGSAQPSTRHTPARGAHQPFELSTEMTAALEQLSRDEGVTLFMTLLAGFQTLLHRYTGEEDVSVATPVATREPEAEAVVGCFMNTLVLRGDLSGDPTFRELLQRTRRVTLEAFEHQDVPFERVVEAVRPALATGHTPVFETMLVLHNARLPELRVAGLDLRPVDIESGTAVTDLALLLDTGPRLTGMLEYNSERFDAAAVQRLLEHFRTMLAGVVADPERRLSALRLLSPGEQHQVLVEWNDTGTDLGEPQCLHELVAAQAGATPDAVAVTCGSATLTYAELDQRANQLAHHLRQLGVEPEAIVGVCMERSPNMVVALLAVLKAGGAYLPLDPTHPAARMRFQLGDARVAAVLTQQRLLDALPAQPAPLVPLDTAWEQIALEPADSPTSAVTVDNLAYVIYTSGSTGQPKGVMVEHRAVCNHLRWRQRAVPLDETDAVLQRTPLTFDPSVWEVFGPLAAGARLVLPEPGTDRDGAALLRVVAEQDVTTFQAVPAVLDALLEQPGIRSCRVLRRVFCGGEPLRLEVQKRFFERLSAELHHVYGPTEAAIETTHWRCREGDGSAIVPIGRPIANATVHILDDHLQPVPVGVAGELHIGGAGLARGYLHRPELTRQRFIPHPFSNVPGERLYRSGDLGRWRADGSIEFLGRVDEQVKVRGFRVESGEVEAVLAEHPAVRDVAVVACEPAPADRRLVAFVVASEDGLTRTELQRSASERLPDYMIPSAFVVRDALPRTASGKVDRALLGREGFGSDTASELVGPRDAVELRLVRIWESLLPGRPIGVTDDFFELGGHSLLAMRAVARVHHDFGADLPVSSLIRERTIERLACQLRERTEFPSPLVAVQSHGSEQPFVCVHPLSGTIFCYVELAHALGNTRPFYALEAVGLRDGEEPHSRIEDMAGSYLEALRDVQPAGPYLLGGWSMGGMVAFEMARQLEAEGQHVALLAVLDAHPAPPDIGPGDQTLLRSFVQDLGLSPDELTVSVAELWELGPDDQLACVLELARAGGLVPPDADVSGLRRQLRVFTHNLRAMRDYTPRPYPGPVTLIEASATGGARDRAAPWEKLAAGGMMRYTVPGDHYTMLRQPNVSTLAERLSACFEAAKLVTS